jgi:F-type H+-transporting ATPase subunit epsilon
MTIRCEVVSQDRLVFEGDVDIVVLPGTDGEMGILPNHAPLLTTLQFGVVKVRVGIEEEVFAVGGGVAEIQPKIVTILADTAESVEEIDISRAEAAKQRAEDLLAEGPPKDDIDKFLALEAALRRSNLRLESVRRYRTGRGSVLHINSRETEDSGSSN